MFTELTKFAASKVNTVGLTDFGKKLLGRAKAEEAIKAEDIKSKPELEESKPVETQIVYKQKEVEIKGNQKDEFTKQESKAKTSNALDTVLNYAGFNLAKQAWDKVTGLTKSSKAKNTTKVDSQEIKPKAQQGFFDSVKSFVLNPVKSISSAVSSIGSVVSSVFSPVTKAFTAVSSALGLSSITKSIGNFFSSTTSLVASAFGFGAVKDSNIVYGEELEFASLAPSAISPAVVSNDKGKSNNSSSVAQISEAIGASTKAIQVAEQHGLEVTTNTTKAELKAQLDDVLPTNQLAQIFNLSHDQVIEELMDDGLNICSFINALSSVDAGHLIDDAVSLASRGISPKALVSRAVARFNEAKQQELMNSRSIDKIYNVEFAENVSV